jgi:zinc transport system permease protein
VTIAMRTVGLLLVSALMVVPVAAAQQVTRGFRSTMALAMLIGVCAAGAGVVLSGEIDTAPGATTVLIALAGFLITTAAGALWHRPRRRRTASPSHIEPPDVVLHA